jgi:hypothetical protein
MEPKMTGKRGSKAAKATRDISLGADKASQVRGGNKPVKTDGNLEAGVRFKYDIKG